MEQAFPFPSNILSFSFALVNGEAKRDVISTYIDLPLNGRDASVVVMVVVVLGVVEVVVVGGGVACMKGRTRKVRKGTQKKKTRKKIKKNRIGEKKETLVDKRKEREKVKAWVEGQGKKEEQEEDEKRGKNRGRGNKGGRWKSKIDK